MLCSYKMETSFPFHKNDSKANTLSQECKKEQMEEERTLNVYQGLLI